MRYTSDRILASWGMIVFIFLGFLKNFSVQIMDHELKTFKDDGNMDGGNAIRGGWLVMCEGELHPL
jgi:F0F1-type ATP synthase assembly protein I